ncbi:MAG: hypothetical protein EXR07_19145 [Acetobacteraceae bacterium]|nr:hypothetical protein [Acetobacteraceae bacterium]
MSRKRIIAILALTTWAGSANAFTGKCVLQVDGKTYLNGPCPITLEKGGDFTVGADGTKSAKFFATVLIDKEAGTADGWWNGTEGGGHAHDKLGTLTRQGACWVNERAKVRATR